MAAHDVASPSRSKLHVLSSLTKLADQGNLAAVLVQLNDTYFIDERIDSGIPGMARIAGLIGEIRALVRTRLKEDRTLVLHCGDYLSPSAMSMKFEGAQMVQLLNRCGVAYSTLGNHEFDFEPLVLQKRLSEAKFTTVVTNLIAPAPLSPLFERLVFWPKRDPFLAIAGFAGSQTADKAVEKGFERISLDEAIGFVLSKVRLIPQVGALIALTHMSREEDKNLQPLLGQKWHKNNFVYMLGGHDHDIHWRERDWGNCFLSKCLSNCRSITIFPIPKDGLSTPLKDSYNELDRGKTIAQLMKLMEQDRLMAEKGLPAELMPDKETCFEQAVTAYRRIMPKGIRTDFQVAFENRIREIFDDAWGMLRQSALHGTLEREAIDMAAHYTYDTFTQGDIEISAPQHFSEWEIDDEAKQLVKLWTAKMGVSGQSDVVMDFEKQLPPSTRALDATDKSLRWHSTDFGNFVGDAVRAATGADIALINAGCFRLDGPVPPAITMKILRDVFVYDSPDAIVTLELTCAEVQCLCDHASKEGGHGRFLQLSDTQVLSAAQAGSTLRVAVVKHMLTDSEDCFQGILTKSRKVPKERIFDALGGSRLPHDSIVNLIAAGSSKVSYSDALRMSVAPSLGSSLEIKATDFIKLVDKFYAACNKAGIDRRASLNLLEGGEHIFGGPPPSLPLAALREELQAFARKVVLEGGQDLINQLWALLYHSQHSFSQNFPYHDFLDRSLTHVWLRKGH